MVDRIVGAIHRGDIIIFKYPEDNSVQYVSRVIGLPGETIEVRRSKVYINEMELRERRVFVEPDGGGPPLVALSSEGEGSYSALYYAGEDEMASTLPSFMDSLEIFGANKPYAVPSGHYFVMGDNRDNSHDSRFWGTVPHEFITGKPYMVYWSVERHEAGNERIRWNRIFSRLK